MARTTATLVQKIVDVHGADTAAKDANIQPWIDQASTILDNAIAQCSDLGNLDTTTLEMIERNMAAHYYANSPQGKTARLIKSDQVGDGVGRSWVTPTAKASAGFSWASTTYGQAVLDLDYTGCLARLGKKKAKLFWIGTPHDTNTHKAGEA